MLVMLAALRTKLVEYALARSTLFSNALAIVALFTLAACEVDNDSIFCHVFSALCIECKRLAGKLEPATGFEPVTSPLPRKCSTN